MNHEQNFIIEIHDDNREFVFKVKCGNEFEGLLFYIANFTKGYKKEEWFSKADFTFKFFNREDFDKIVEWGKHYGEVL